MAVIENRFVCDLSKPVQAQALKGNVFSLDNLGSRISVLIYDNGQPATISGSVTANCILPDGSTVNVNGGLTTENGGSKAYVDVPQSCLLITGILKIAIKCTSSSVITTLAAIVANVYMTKTDNVITPSQQIITDWNAEISAAIATQNAAIANQDTKINDLKSALDEHNAVLPKETLAKTSKAQNCVKISDGTFTPISNTYCATEFDVSGCTFVLVSAHLSSPNNNYASYLFVDSIGNILEYKNTEGNGTFTNLGLPVPTSAKFLRLGTLTEDYTSAKVEKLLDIDGVIEDQVEPIYDRMTNLENGYRQVKNIDIIQGSYNIYGDVVDNPKRIRTRGFIDVKAGDTLSFTPGANASNMLYGIFTTSGSFVSDNGYYNTNFSVQFDQDRKIIIVFKNGTDTNLSPNDYDATVKIVSDVTESVKNYVAPIKKDLNELYTVQNLFNKGNIMFANSTMAGDGSISANENYDVYHVDLMSAQSSVYMVGALEIMTFRCYNASGTALGSKQAYIGKSPTEVELYANTRYIRFGCNKTYQPYFMMTLTPTYEYMPYHKLDVVVQNSASNWWAGKIGDSLGDSLTEQKYFQLYTKKYFGLSKFYIHGIGGTKMSGPANQYGDSMWMDSRINALSVDADFVTVLGGQNDGNVEIGDISKSNLDTDTYAGALNTVINKIYAHCKTGIVIILCTPFYVPSEGVGGERFIALDEAVRGIAKLHGLPVADFGGLSTADENTADLYWGADRTHPIEKFYKEKIAPILISTMENIRPIDWDKINNYGKFIDGIQYLP